MVQKPPRVPGMSYNWRLLLDTQLFAELQLASELQLTFEEHRLSYPMTASIWRLSTLFMRTPPFMRWDDMENSVTSEGVSASEAATRVRCCVRVQLRKRRYDVVAGYKRGDERTVMTNHRSETQVSQPLL
jgi:hypothetical protein